MRLPTKVMVLGIPYKVQIASSKEMKDNWGEAFIEKGVIKIKADLSPDLRFQVLVHECLHVLFAFSKVKVSDKKEEELIESIDEILYAFLKENNWLPNRRKRK